MCQPGWALRLLRSGSAPRLLSKDRAWTRAWGLRRRVGVPLSHPRARTTGQGCLQPSPFPCPGSQRRRDSSGDTNNNPTLRAHRASEQSLALISDHLPGWE